MISLKNNTLQVESLGTKKGKPIVFIGNTFSTSKKHAWTQYLYQYFPFYDCQTKIDASHLEKHLFPLRKTLEDFSELLLVLQEGSILMTETLMCPFVMQLAMLQPQRVGSIVLISPPSMLQKRRNMLRSLDSDFFRWLSAVEGGSPSKRWRQLSERSRLFRNYWKSCSLVYSQQISVQSYLFMGMEDPNTLMSPAAVTKLFPKARVFKFDSKLEGLTDERRFKKVLYSVLKQENKRNAII
ncbi:MAG: hypothetical protein AAF518_01060 [Spirochaetota bacterium]